MNRIKTDLLGRYPFNITDLAFMQAAYDYATGTLAKGLANGGDVVILWGCEVSGTACTAGAICYKGEVMQVDASSNVSASRPLVFTPSEQNDPVLDPTTFANGTVQSWHLQRRAVLVPSGSVSASESVPGIAAATNTDKALQAPRLAWLQRDAAWPVGAPMAVGSAVAAAFNASGLGQGEWAGWALCDGSNGTLDLRGRMVVGRNTADADFDNIGDTGGAKAVTLTSAQSGVPAHQHAPPSGSTNYATWGQWGLGSQQPTSNSGAGFITHYAQSGSNTAADAAQAHTNMPPFYTLAYIQRI